MANIIIPKTPEKDVKAVRLGYSGEGLEQPMFLYPPGNVVSTKGEVPCWEGKVGSRETGTINGLGEVISGPDETGRYEVLIKGCRVWVFHKDMVFKGR